MKGMRNRIAHGYFEINLETVWDTLKTALPSLIEQCRRFVATSDEREAPSKLSSFLIKSASSPYPAGASSY